MTSGCGSTVNPFVPESRSFPVATGSRSVVLAALVIGTLPMGFALLLAWEQKRLLLGESMEPWQEEEIGEMVAEAEEVSGCRHLRTVFFGASYVLLTADVVFEDDLPAARVEDVVDELDARIRERFPRIRAVYLETDIEEREEPTRSPGAPPRR